MAKLYFYYSTMNAGKSTTLLQSSYNYRERDMNTLVYTAAIDDRFGGGKVTSRLGISQDAFLFRSDTNLFDEINEHLKKEKVHCVLVDEAHRSQYDFLAAFMRASLPNAKFIAFTGTPLLNDDKHTLAEFGGDTYGADNFMFQRGNGMATYRNSNFFGLVDGWNFAVQYQGKNDNPSRETSGRDVLGENGDGWGLSTTYDLGSGLGIGAAMFSSDRTNNQNGGDPAILGRGDKAEVYTGGLKYDANNIYLAAMYSRSYNASRFGSTDDDIHGFADKADNWELVAQYQFDFGLRPSLAFVTSRGTDIHNWGKQNLKKYVDVGATYYFNKNMSTYVDYQINLMDDNDFTDAAGINTDDTVALGLVYQF